MREQPGAKHTHVCVRWLRTSVGGREGWLVDGFVGLSALDEECFLYVTLWST